MPTIRKFLLVAAVLVSACKTTEPQGVRVEFREVIKEVPRPCPVAKPVRPKKLARPLPKQPRQLIDLLTAKLLEWDGPGGFGDRALDAIETCTKP